MGGFQFCRCWCGVSFCVLYKPMLLPFDACQNSLCSSSQYFRCQVFVKLSGKKFQWQTLVPTGWFHQVIVLTGTAETQGFIVYFNGTEVGQKTNLVQTGHEWYPRSAMLVGDAETGADVAVDELLIWLRKLTPGEIYFLFDSYIFQ